MVRSFAFTTQGRLHTKDIDAFLMPTLLADTNLFLWVDLENPTAEESRFYLEEVFRFHPLSIEDCVAESPSPKVEEYEPKEEDFFTPYLFIVLHAVDYSRKDGVFATSELNFFMGRNFLVTYHVVPLRGVTTTAERCVRSNVHIARAPTGWPTRSSTPSSRTTSPRWTNSRWRSPGSRNRCSKAPRRTR